MLKTIEALILGLLHIRPLTSYELNKALQQLASHHFSPSYGTLHPALRRLEERHGWLSSTETQEGGRRKKAYAITDAGRTAFDNWMRHPEDDPKRSQNNAMLARLFLLGLMSPEDRLEVVRHIKASVDAIHTELTAHLTTAQARLESEVPEDLADIARHQIATLEFGVAHHQFVSNWLTQRYLEENTE